MTKRQAKVKSAWKGYIDRAPLSDFDKNKFLKRKRLPNIALAMSGGGFRGQLVGAGLIQAMDDRHEASKNLKTGGLLQMSTYFSACSGKFSFFLGH